MYLFWDNWGWRSNVFNREHISYFTCCYYMHYMNGRWHSAVSVVCLQFFDRWIVYILNWLTRWSKRFFVSTFENSNKPNMRNRSNSGVRLDYYQRIVYKTILSHQVSLFDNFLKLLLNQILICRIQFLVFCQLMNHWMIMHGFVIISILSWPFGHYQWHIRRIPI